jgi:hypothetical protein
VPPHNRWMLDTRHRFLDITTAVLLGAGLCGCASAPVTASPAPSIEAAPAPAASAASAIPVPVPGRPATQQAGSGPARPWSYRCDGGLEFNVRFGDGAATVDAAPGGSQVLLRDAGGATPQQTVYSNERMRVEFGLGEGGREAIVREAGAADGVHCVAQ